ncbi:sugar transferase [Exiguobacterium artemiae]|uniref:sugar transferase n=1 Tax=Exiguobacterium artemiae TaxID=340145 RepID=UPI0029651F4B|nr:sugar transferase [Exiguobacterium sibiricum]MDW2886770.1 sugar transferase [Exiguobacterium sibiricum]
MKRTVDFIFSLILIIFLFPIIIITAIFVFIFIGKPIIFKQLRPGKNAEPFHVYKFRTMTNEKDSNGELLSDVERLNAHGKLIRKLSLDELPQLFNVLKGDLSLVGPRPLLMEYLPLYNSNQKRRHEVKPGITGWAQINGRNAISWNEKFKLDVWYVENQSLLLDFKILLLTVKKVFISEGISNGNHVTIEKFKGNKEIY